MRLLPKASRGISLLLLVSLCVNVLLVAFLATYWFDRLRVPFATAGPTRLIEFVATRLPPSDREILWRVYRSKEAAFAKASADYQSSLRAAGQTLSQDPLDPQVLRRAVDEARTKRLVVGDLAIETFLEAFPQMSAEGRRDLTGKFLQKK